MKNCNLILKMSIAALLVGHIGIATADEIDGTATARVVEPLTVLENIAMAFGDVATGSSAGTIVITPGGTPSATGGAAFIPSTGASNAKFDITGQSNANIIVNVDGTGATLARVGGGTMSLGTFTNSGLPTVLTGTTATFNVGATLSISSPQTAGAYSTANTADGGVPYKVTVNYN